MSNEIWDREATLQRFNHKQQMLEKIVAKYLQAAPTTIAELEQSLQQSDQQAVKAGAHTLKGMSATVGAVQVADLCAALEAEALVISAESCSDALEQIKLAQAAFQRVVDEG